MSGLDEDAALVKVSEGLVARFPAVDPATVRSVVAEARSRFDGPVRDYVPLLVERVCRERLTALASASSST
ncbi:hypothetical protein BJ986_001779 [Phycicoccus badiiscoriae]|uniref:Uncharacterized protein n=1 Tax=Pedococcus badiiscoriae TaxID=642776 RepID=A0A852WPW9_9MICO|nr:hypothetical protein [Pedococcus badiiscoriae]NYG07292.1 hypothetical protein [Pedococcus badiiscoriae]